MVGMAGNEQDNDLLADLDVFLAEHEAELIEFRRDLHAHPELAFNEHRTTRRVALRLAAAGLRPVILPKGTGMLVDIGSEQVPYTQRPVGALRAEMDAPPVVDEKGAAHPSTRPDVCHRSGPGGHTARPHLTADLVYALGKILTEVPAALSRRVDPRSSLSLVWGRVSAGTVANAIPDEGLAEGTVRCLDEDAWHSAPDLLKGLLASVATPCGVNAPATYQRD